MATAELKNPLSGQRVKHAIQQYRLDRDPRDKIFEFKKRALVHFAVDPDEVYMTTRLARERTFFLPFNKGRDLGAGNPDNPDGYKTAYLWEEVWERAAWLDILSRFLHLEVKEEKKIGKKTTRETMIFPRYHQWDSVRKMEADARQAGAGKNYLVQHSAGSGKSNSIAWLAHRLASLHDAQDEKIFHCVIVITDRLVLDKQLQDTIYQFEHKQGVVEKIEQDSNQLAKVLKEGVPIVITTLQKFPFVMEKVGELPARNYAVIVDEAHSSQSGESAAELKGVLAGQAIREQAQQEADEQGLIVAGRMPSAGRAADAGGCAAVDPALCRALQHGAAAQRDRVCDAGGHAGRTQGTDPRRAGPPAGAGSTATSVTPSAGNLSDPVTMVLPGKTEAGCAGKQPCRGIGRRAHRDDDHGRGSPLSRWSPSPIGSIDPDALKIPARRAQSTLPRSARSPVPAEPAQHRQLLKEPMGAADRFVARGQNAVLKLGD